MTFPFTDEHQPSKKARSAALVAKESSAAAPANPARGRGRVGAEAEAGAAEEKALPLLQLQHLRDPSPCHQQLRRFRRGSTSLWQAQHVFVDWCAARIARSQEASTHCKPLQR